MHFLGMYVGKVMGLRKINKWASSNKGKTMLHKMSVCDVSYCVFVLVNHEAKWEYDILKKMSEPEEKYKYEHFDDIQDDKERAKYAPKHSRYSAGAGAKRRFGSTLTSDEGHVLLDGIQKNWTKALSDRKTWLWLLDGWDEWVESSGVCVHWKKKKDKSRRTIEEEDDGLQDKDAGMMVLPGDAGFVDVRSQAWMESADYKEADGDRKDDAPNGGKRGTWVWWMKA